MSHTMIVTFNGPAPTDVRLVKTELNLNYNYHFGLEHDLAATIGEDREALAKELDCKPEALVFVSIEPDCEDSELLRFNVDATYSDGDPWTDYVWGRDETEAAFFGLLQVAENVVDDTNADYLDDYMDRCRILSCDPVKVSPEEVQDTLLAIVQQFDAGSVTAETIEAARAQLIALHRITVTKAEPEAVS